MTCLTSGTSTPRAAESVHTSAVMDPSAKDSNRSPRSFVLTSAWKDAARSPCRMSSAVTSSHALVELTNTSVRSFCASVPKESARPSASARVESLTSTHVCDSVATALCSRRPSTHDASGNPYLIIAPGVFFPLLITVAAAKMYCLRNSRPSPTPTSPLPPRAAPWPMRLLLLLFAAAFMSAWSAAHARSPPSFGRSVSPLHSSLSGFEPATVKPSAASFSSRYKTSNAPRTGLRYPPERSWSASSKTTCRM
mmetsp:Transcript_10179/g.46350  ORF Transcript_10179/g.46350 Transcript_10179/m.46350 type:complete len:252 (-) Transcript_10179:939-1694(-)